MRVKGKRRLPALRMEPGSIMAACVFSVGARKLGGISSVVNDISKVTRYCRLNGKTNLYHFTPVCYRANGKGKIVGKDFAYFKRPRLARTETSVARFLGLVVMEISNSERRTGIRVARTMGPPRSRPKRNSRGPRRSRVRVRLPSSRGVMISSMRIPPSRDNNKFSKDIDS